MSHIYKVFGVSFTKKYALRYGSFCLKKKKRIRSSSLMHIQCMYGMHGIGKYSMSTIEPSRPRPLLVFDDRIRHES